MSCFGLVAIRFSKGYGYLLIHDFVTKQKFPEINCTQRCYYTKYLLPSPHAMLSHASLRKLPSYSLSLNEHAALLHNYQQYYLPSKLMEYSKLKQIINNIRQKTSLPISGSVYPVVRSHHWLLV